MYILFRTNICFMNQIAFAVLPLYFLLCRMITGCVWSTKSLRETKCPSALSTPLAASHLRWLTLPDSMSR